LNPVSLSVDGAVVKKTFIIWETLYSYLKINLQTW
jgi:hypothetical protein